MFDLAARQRGAGDEVAFFGMRHAENEPMPLPAALPPAGRPRAPAPMACARRTARPRTCLVAQPPPTGMAAVLDAFRPDVVHLHNIYHQLSPSILRPLAPARRPGGDDPARLQARLPHLPVPRPRRDLRGLPAPPVLGADRAPLQRRLARRERGERRSSSRSHTLDRRLRAPSRRFICPSRFLLEKMRAGQGLSRPGCAGPAELRGRGRDRRPKTAPGGGVLSAGRLSAEKGVDVLVDAVAPAAGARRSTSPATARSGAALEALAASRRADRVRVPRARSPPTRSRDLLRGAAVAAVPSRWYENMPLAVLEAFARGVPVVATGSAGSPELIDPGVDGAIVAAGRPGRARRGAAAVRRRPRPGVRDGSRGRPAEGDVDVRRPSGTSAPGRRVRSTPEAGAGVTPPADRDDRRPRRPGHASAGSSTTSRSSARGWSTAGHEVTVFCADELPATDPVTEHRGMRVRGPAHRRDASTSTRSCTAGSRRSAAMASSFDVLHYHAIGPGILAALPRCLSAARRSS